MDLRLEEALREAGFRMVTWHAPRVSPSREADRDDGYWASFLAHRPVIFLECLK